MAPSTYYAAKQRQPSARAIRDAMLKNVLFVLWSTNRKVYGAHKLWKAARRAGHDLGRDQVARLMRELGIRGVSKCRKRVFTTRSDPDAGRPADLVKRDFSAAHPNGLWVTDLTYVPTRTGMAYVCFITDAFSRMIVGWRVAAHMRTDMVLDALEMARHPPSPGRSRDPLGRRIAVHFRALHRAPRRDRSDTEHRHGRRFVRQRPRRGDQRPLQDRVRLRAHTNGWEDVSHLELATLSWVHWFNEERLHGYCGDIPPAEFEAAFYAGNQPALPGLGNQ